MLPLRDNIPSRSFPLITLLIVIANAVTFAMQLSLGPQMAKLFYVAGIVPKNYSIFLESGGGDPLTLGIPLLTYMFLHGGWLHIIGNLWILWIFGDNVEDRMGKFRFMIFYLLCGVFSGVFHLVTNPHSNLPTVGASGAIAGVMGAYFILYPRARVLTLVPIFIFIQFIELPAFIFLGIWFLFQFLSGTKGLLAGASQASGGIAWWAHIGGFLAGMLLVKIFSRRRLNIE